MLYAGLTRPHYRPIRRSFIGIHCLTLNFSLVCPCMDNRTLPPVPVPDLAEFAATFARVNVSDIKIRKLIGKSFSIHRRASSG